jgi:hypothetical protein
MRTPMLKKVLNITTVALLISSGIFGWQSSAKALTVEECERIFDQDTSDWGVMNRIFYEQQKASCIHNAQQEAPSNITTESPLPPSTIPAPGSIEEELMIQCLSNPGYMWDGYACVPMW